KFVAVEALSFGSGPNPQTLEQFRSGTGAANSPPRVGPVVINEIMYNPGSAPDGSDNTADEYIEIVNISNQPAPFYDPEHPENRWRFQGGLSFDFPAAVTLAPSEYALIVSFDPVA